MSTPEDLSGRAGPSRRGTGGRAPHRRNASATRANILANAKMQFCARGYDNVGLRDIAAAAGVDAALVARYFGSKDALFAEVVAAVVDPSAMFAGDRAGLGLRLARHVVDGGARTGECGVDPIMLIMRSASSPRGAALLRVGLDERFIRPLAAWLGGRDALARAALVSSHLMGASMMHAVFGPDSMAGTRAERFAKGLAPALQACIDGVALPSPPAAAAGARAPNRPRSRGPARPRTSRRT